MPDTCEYHTELVKDIAVIKNDLTYIKDKVCRHIVDGEKEGGFRDRLLIAEKEIQTLQKALWRSCIVAGVIGGLLGKVTPDLINWLVTAVFAGL